MKKKLKQTITVLFIGLLFISGCKKDETRTEEGHSMVSAIMADGKLLIKVKDGNGERLLSELKVSDKYKLIAVNHATRGIGVRLVLNNILKPETNALARRSNYMWLIQPDDYIFDGTAIASCNGAYDSKVILEEFDNGTLMPVVLSSTIYVEVYSNYIEIEEGQDEATDQYFECWVEHDPVNTVTRVLM